MTSPLLAKSLRGLQRSWKGENISPHPLVEGDITSLITMMAVYLRKELLKKLEKKNEEKLKKRKLNKKKEGKKNGKGKGKKRSKEDSESEENDSSDEDEEIIDVIPEFCLAFHVLHQCLEAKSFEPLFGRLENQGSAAGGDGQEEGSLTLSSDCSANWTHRGLIKVFHRQEFTFLFFQSFALLVQQFSKPFTNLFGTVSIPTDDSITEALLHLPPGYSEILRILQFEIAAKTVSSLFLTVYDSKEGFGGPGTTLRLIIDMVESQLFNTKAINEQLILTPVQDMTLGSALLDSIIGVLGPYPSNMAYGPILMHLFYVEASSTPPRYDLLLEFLEHCNNPEYGLPSKNEEIGIHKMGLQTVIGSFIFNDKPVAMSHRFQDLFCRSQIENENVASILPLEILKKVMDTICNLEEYDNFTLISIGDAVTYIEKYGLELVSEVNIRKIYTLLISDPDLYKDVIDEDCYEQLLTVCQKILPSVGK